MKNLTIIFSLFLMLSCGKKSLNEPEEKTDIKANEGISHVIETKQLVHFKGDQKIISISHTKGEKLISEMKTAFFLKSKGENFKTPSAHHDTIDPYKMPRYFDYIGVQPIQLKNHENKYGPYLKEKTYIHLLDNNKLMTYSFSSSTTLKNFSQRLKLDLSDWDVLSNLHEMSFLSLGSRVFLVKKDLKTNLDEIAYDFRFTETVSFNLNYYLTNKSYALFKHYLDDSGKYRKITEKNLREYLESTYIETIHRDILFNDILDYKKAVSLGEYFIVPVHLPYDQILGLHFEKKSTYNLFLTWLF